MPFWSTNFAEDATLNDPKRKFRFMVSFENINAEIGGAQMWYASSCNKPGFAINPAEHKYLNHTFYYPGKVTWQKVTVTLVDPVTPDATGNLLTILKSSGYTIC